MASAIDRFDAPGDDERDVIELSRLAAEGLDAVVHSARDVARAALGVGAQDLVDAVLAEHLFGLVPCLPDAVGRRQDDAAERQRFVGLFGVLLAPHDAQRQAAGESFRADWFSSHAQLDRYLVHAI